MVGFDNVCANVAFVVLGISCLLIVILVPMSFSDLEYYEVYLQFIYVMFCMHVCLSTSVYLCFLNIASTSLQFSKIMFFPFLMEISTVKVKFTTSEAVRYTPVFMVNIFNTFYIHFFNKYFNGFSMIIEYDGSPSLSLINKAMFHLSSNTDLWMYIFMYI